MNSLKSIVLVTVIAISGCASGIVVPTEADNTLRLMSGQAAAPTEENAGEPTPAVDRIKLTVESSFETDEAPADAASDAAPASEDTPFADDAVQAPVEETIPPAPTDEPTDGAMISDALDKVEPDKADRPVARPRRERQPAIAPAMKLPRPIETQPIETEPLLPEDHETQEIVDTPQAQPASPFRPGKDEAEDINRLNRQLVDVPVDLRPSEGDLPTDLAAAKFAGEPTIDETFGSPDDAPPDVFCAFTPWTICYRPLYFEDIPLERYGCNVGRLQTGLSGVKFFGSIALLPYKMTVRPPRSCQCSNGFSRCGDCPIPGYGRRQFRLDAAAVEGAAIAAAAFILP